MIVVNQSAVPISAGSDPDPGRRASSIRPTADQAPGLWRDPRLLHRPATWPAKPGDHGRLPARPGGDAAATSSCTRSLAAQSEMDLLLRTSLVRASGVPDTVVAQLIMPVQYVDAGTNGGQSSDAAILSSFLVPYAFTLIFMLSIFITSGYLLQSVTEEKENRVVEILLSSIPALPLMAGKVLGLGAAGLTQVAIWVGTALVALPLLNSQFQLTIQISPLTLVLAVIFFASRLHVVWRDLRGRRRARARRARSTAVRERVRSDRGHTDRAAACVPE